MVRLAMISLDYRLNYIISFVNTASYSEILRDYIVTLMGYSENQLAKASLRDGVHRLRAVQVEVAPQSSGGEEAAGGRDCNQPPHSGRSTAGLAVAEWARRYRLAAGSPWQSRAWHPARASAGNKDFERIYSAVFHVIESV